MNWTAFFNDLYKWMQASNVMERRLGLANDEYWRWLVHTLTIIRDRYSHPLVLQWLLTMTYYQGERLAKMHGTHLNLFKAGGEHV